MVRERLQFNFFITKEDGNVHACAVDRESNERFTYVVSEDGEVYRRNEAFPYSGWQFLSDDESDFIRGIAERSRSFIIGNKR